MDARHIMTIGHSTHPAEHLMGLLTQHGVTAVADVRSSPYSRLNPQFNREALHAALKVRKIAYVFLGRELGARSEDPNCYDAGKVQYGRLAQTPEFNQGIARVLKGLERYNIALLCSERDPLYCHRTILVSRVLERLGVEVKHIHGDGRLEKHQDAMRRLLGLVGLPPHDFFRSAEQLLDEAYRMQEDKIAYVDEKQRLVNTSDATSR
ncbi:DUF488 family protein [Archangium violaceum]|uniref:DUF488 domain-containing protein n=1 Tax=Archangium violaceum TaxID=83451 RepID=UPI000949878D|nr:DUF488 domain-containing protein [Archangium violaceum]